MHPWLLVLVTSVALPALLSNAQTVDDTSLALDWLADHFIGPSQQDNRTWLIDSPWLQKALLSNNGPPIGGYPRLNGVESDWIPMQAMQTLRAQIQNNTVPSGKNASLMSLLDNASKCIASNTTYSVTFTSATPPNGNKHYYYTWNPYAWPKCGKARRFITDIETQCHWKVRDGHVNPVVSKLTSGSQLKNMITETLTLNLAYYLYNDTRYAAKAVKNLETFFINTTTRMEPSLKYAQVFPGGAKKHWKGSRMGILDTRNLVTLVSSLQFLNGSQVYTNYHQEQLQAWFTNYTQWLTTSSFGKQEAASRNNHVTFYSAQVAGFSLFTGQTNLTKAAIANYTNYQYNLQFNASGAEPLELLRPFSFHYAYFNLEALTCLAAIAKQINIDLYNTPNKNNQTIQTAVDYLVNLGADYIARKETPAPLLPLLETTIQHYGNATLYQPFIDSIRNETNGGDESALWILWKT